MNGINTVIKEEILDGTDIVIKTEPPDNIKEKLTNHLKRRQRIDEIPHLPIISSAQIHHRRHHHHHQQHQLAASGASIVEPQPPPSPIKIVPKKLSKLTVTTGKKNKMQRSISNIETMSASKLQNCIPATSGNSINNYGGGGSVNNSNDEEKYGPHEGQTPSAATSPTEKSKTPDIITTILNQKRMSLMQDPEVIRFLDSVSGKNKRMKTTK